MQASFGRENIQNMLDTYKEGGQGDPLFYYKGRAPIPNRSSSAKLVTEVRSYLDGLDLGDTMQQTIRLNGDSYLVSLVKSPLLGGYLVDIAPLDQILGPISSSRNLFYLSMLLLFLFGTFISVLLYRDVQRPIAKLIGGLKQVQRGDFSARIDAKANGEFTFLFYRFNDMSRQIESLIENVLNERMRAQEATMKQLQAQINPHFLYNCLGYMINMAQMKENDAVVAMGYNLSAYYRYITRMEKETASLAEEMKLIVNYLDIQKLRNGRIHYTIDVPEEMLAQQVPRLMLQPLVENAVIHGVGKSFAAGEIRIRGGDVGRPLPDLRRRRRTGHGSREAIPVESTADRPARRRHGRRPVEYEPAHYSLLRQAFQPPFLPIRTRRRPLGDRLGNAEAGAMTHNLRNPTRSAFICK
ncbi:histidine kinase [Cohnella ginsengisoli]|uniref:Histidine kinase n=1 Tax=Cohnella ginsengisoli TaxID=425004 RepID=A0A9X4KSY6_9BACL|nr:histidine kinase [Cohnella ginsengisoli]MDG0795000.1 histidine kinase [Cohnella ginsengisoli]